MKHNKVLFTTSWVVVLFVVFVSGHAIFFGNHLQQLIGGLIWLSFELGWVFGRFGTEIRYFNEVAENDRSPKEPPGQ